MSITIGRATFPTPPQEAFSGDVLAVSGIDYDSDISVLLARRQQLLGYKDNPDEPVIPVLTDYDDLIDGYYRLLDASVEIVDGGHALKQFRWSANLSRVADYAAPLIESILIAPSVRTNAHSLTDGLDWQAVPSIAKSDGQYSVGAIASAGFIMDTPDGAMTTHVGTTTHTYDLEDAVATYRLDPANWYIGGCRLELDYGDDGNFYPVTGRQIINLPDDGRWRLTNGGLLVTDERVSSSEWALGLARWLDGSQAYSTVKEFDIGFEDSGVVDRTQPPRVLSVLRNSPEEVVIRLVKGAGGHQRITFDISIKRGCPWIELVASADYLGTGMPAGDELPPFGVQAQDAETSEDLDNPTAYSGLEGAGIKATGADGDGLFYFIASADDVTLDTTNREVYLAAAELEASFVLGLAENDDNGTGFPTADSPGSHTLMYMKAMSETVRVVEQ